MSNSYEEITGQSKGSVLNVGHGNYIRQERIIAVVSANSLPMKRLREKALEQNYLVDATAGRKVKSVLITDSKYVFLSALSPATLQERLESGREIFSLAEAEPKDGEFVS